MLAIFVQHHISILGHIIEFEWWTQPYILLPARFLMLAVQW